MSGDPEDSPTATDPEALGAIAVAMIRDESEGLALAGAAAIGEARACALRDRLVAEAGFVLGGGLEALRLRAHEQTQELSRLVIIAEEYRTGRLPRLRLRRPWRPRSHEWQELRAWLVRRLPLGVKSRIRSFLKRAG